MAVLYSVRVALMASYQIQKPNSCRTERKIESEIRGILNSREASIHKLEDISIEAAELG